MRIMKQLQGSSVDLSFRIVTKYKSNGNQRLSRGGLVGTELTASLPIKMAPMTFKEKPF